MTAVAAGPGELTGRVVRPDDGDHAAAAAGWNLLYAHQPSVIIFAQETTDVVNALGWARRSRVPVRVRSGRHSLEGWSSVGGGVVIDLREHLRALPKLPHRRQPSASHCGSTSRRGSARRRRLRQDRRDRPATLPGPAQVAMVNSGTVAVATHESSTSVKRSKKLKIIVWAHG